MNSLCSETLDQIPFEIFCVLEKEYLFPSCYKCFSDEQSLLEHIPKHKESKHLKVHICSFCGKSYTQATYLAKHMTKHSDRKPPKNSSNTNNNNNQLLQQHQAPPSTSSASAANTNNNQAGMSNTGQPNSVASCLAQVI